MTEGEPQLFVSVIKKAPIKPRVQKQLILDPLNGHRRFVGNSMLLGQPIQIKDYTASIGSQTPARGTHRSRQAEKELPETK